MSKYDETILKLMSKTTIKSTNEIRGELIAKTGKEMNWHALYRILTELEREGKIERLESKAGMFWKLS